MSIVRSLQNVKKWRNMPWLKRSMTVEVNGKMGVVTAANSSLNIQVRFEGEKYSQNCHPHWRTRYYDKEGKLIADYYTEEEKQNII